MLLRLGSAGGATLIESRIALKNSGERDRATRLLWEGATMACTRGLLALALAAWSSAVQGATLVLTSVSPSSFSPGDLVTLSWTSSGQASGLPFSLQSPAWNFLGVDTKLLSLTSASGTSAFNLPLTFPLGATSFYIASCGYFSCDYSAYVSVNVVRPSLDLLTAAPTTFYAGTPLTVKFSARFVAARGWKVGTPHA